MTQPELNETTMFDCCEKPTVKISNGRTTAMYFLPILDKHGNNTNPDRNKTLYDCECFNCGKKWSTSE